MKYYHNIDGRETYVGRHVEVKPVATSFIDGIRYLDIDYGTWYIVASGQWIVDKSEYDGTVYNSNGELVNIADAYYNTTVTTEDIETRYFRKGYVYGSGYTWNNVTSNTTINLHIKIGTRPIYMSYSVAGSALSDYGLVNSPTITTNGTANTIIKRNNEIIIEPITLIYRDTTYTGGAIAIPRFIGSSGNAIQRVGGTDVSQKAILQANSDYILSLKNSNTATQERMGIYIDWIEVEI